jgi:hypothetical protein
MAAFRKRYGAGPLHAISVIVALAIAGYAFLEVAHNPGPFSFAVFFAGAIVAHDLVAFPIYSALDRVAGATTRNVTPAGGAINYIRVPAVLSGFALVVWFPLILSLDSAAYEAASGRAPTDYLGRWLALTAALFLGSGVVYAVRRRRADAASDRGPATDPRGPRCRR